MNEWHEPVMGQEVLDFLAPSGTGFYLDGTVGGGGHTRMILEECAECRVLGVDRDPDALERAQETLAEYRSRVRFRPLRLFRIDCFE